MSLIIPFDEENVTDDIFNLKIALLFGQYYPDSGYDVLLEITDYKNFNADIIIRYDIVAITSVLIRVKSLSSLIRQKSLVAKTGIAKLLTS